MGKVVPINKQVKNDFRLKMERKAVALAERIIRKRKEQAKGAE